jgi:hypothetical protein
MLSPPVVARAVAALAARAAVDRSVAPAAVDESLGEAADAFLRQHQRLPCAG